MLLPMPGSPPTKVTEPGTTPPPNTRSSSSIPVGSGRPTCGSISPINVGDDDAGAITGASFGRATSSTKVFHWPQDEHCPAHFGCDAPQSVHTCSIFSLAIPAV